MTWWQPDLKKLSRPRSPAKSSKLTRLPPSAVGCSCLRARKLALPNWAGPSVACRAEDGTKQAVPRTHPCCPAGSLPTLDPVLLGFFVQFLRSDIDVSRPRDGPGSGIYESFCEVFRVAQWFPVGSSVFQARQVNVARDTVAEADAESPVLQDGHGGDVRETGHSLDGTRLSLCGQGAGRTSLGPSIPAGPRGDL